MSVGYETRTLPLAQSYLIILHNMYYYYFDCIYKYEQYLLV